MWREICVVDAFIIILIAKVLLNIVILCSKYHKAGMFRRVKVLFFMEKTIFMGFISVHSFCSLLLSPPHLLTVSLSHGVTSDHA